MALVGKPYMLGQTKKDTQLRYEWSEYRLLIWMFEPHHNLLSNVRVDIRKYVVSWLKHSRGSIRPVPGPKLGSALSPWVIVFALIDGLQRGFNLENVDLRTYFFSMVERLTRDLDEMRTNVEKLEQEKQQTLNELNQRVAQLQTQLPDPKSTMEVGTVKRFLI